MNWIKVEHIMSAVAGWFLAVFCKMFGDGEDVKKVVGFFLMCVAFDFFTGFWKAWRNKDINSFKMRDGVFKKVALISAVSFTYFLQNSGYNPLPINIEIATAGMLTLSECISIMENFTDMGIKLPLVEKVLTIAQTKVDEPIQLDSSRINGGVEDGK